MSIILIRYLNCRPKLRWRAIALHCKYAVSCVLIPRHVVCIDLHEGNLRHEIIEHVSQSHSISRLSGKVTIQIPIDRRQLNVRW
jgi:hypothetical protein